MRQPKVGHLWRNLASGGVFEIVEIASDEVLIQSQDDRVNRRYVGRSKFLEEYTFHSTGRS